ncbi:hypothetical protein P5673_015192 [Acropora cervicornis]|uniref:CCHC-type domain-containing protein n=1 Tax=Acropora cervicornis TaxID=6130 RepID=A0AAD9QI71_ACRCE|nr:hypothetical protein P5673_015192 [Acropora cervicornis]
MSGCIRQRLGPTKKRLKERIEQTQTFLQQQITFDESEGKANELLLKLERNLESYKDLLEQLQEASKDNEAKTQRLDAEMEEFSILTLDGDDAICDLKIFLANIAKRKQETTEREERQRERAHQRELQTEKLQLERELHLAKLNQVKELQMEKMKLELEMLKQNEIDKQREHEQKILEVELEAKRKMAQTEKEMELKRTTVDIELKMKAEMEQKQRFGRDELMMDAHYSALMDLPVSLNVTEKLRATYDMIEKHLRSLKALGENVDQPHFVFLIKSKLPKMVISRMEEYKDMEDKWRVESIRKALKRYICAQEVGERQTQVIQSTESQDTAVKSQKQKSFSSKWSGATTTGALLSGNEEASRDSQTRGCFYCQRKDHWSDQCKTYPTVSQERQKSKETAIFV